MSCGENKQSKITKKKQKIKQKKQIKKKIWAKSISYHVVKMFINTKYNTSWLTLFTLVLITLPRFLSSTFGNSRFFESPVFKLIIIIMMTNQLIELFYLNYNIFYKYSTQRFIFVYFGEATVELVRISNLYKIEMIKKWIEITTIQR